MTPHTLVMKGTPSSADVPDPTRKRSRRRSSRNQTFVLVICIAVLVDLGISIALFTSLTSGGSTSISNPANRSGWLRGAPGVVATRAAELRRRKRQHQQLGEHGGQHR